MQTKHTPGAMRAVQAIYHSGAHRADSSGMKFIADIIDRETGLPELLEACRAALIELADLRPPNVKALTAEGVQNPNVAEMLRAAITKAEPS